MKRKTLYFTAPRQVELREQALPVLGADEVLVETQCSAISAGSEMLLYCGQFPTIVDSFDPISSQLSYPTPYGYACVGRVVQLGARVNPDWAGHRVFSFQPHTSHFTTPPAALFPIPESISLESACFLPNMETAVNLVQDAAPILGERVLVLGQGVIGLLTAALLSEFPLECLVTADNYKKRREASLKIGATASLDASQPDFHDKAKSLLKNGADLTIELTGNPSALDNAIVLTAFSGRILIGSCYGEKRASIDLGGAFHRSRIKLISSQVSTIAPELSTRWDKSRRFQVAWEALERIKPEEWITHRFSSDNAGQAYELLDTNPEETIQVLLEYNS